jgi:hypothetical protein
VHQVGSRNRALVVKLVHKFKLHRDLTLTRPRPCMPSLQVELVECQVASVVVAGTSGGGSSMGSPPHGMSAAASPGRSAGASALPILPHSISPASTYSPHATTSAPRHDSPTVSRLARSGAPAQQLSPKQPVAEHVMPPQLQLLLLAPQAAHGCDAQPLQQLSSQSPRPHTAGSAGMVAGACEQRNRVSSHRTTAAAGMLEDDAMTMTEGDHELSPDHKVIAVLGPDVRVARSSSSEVTASQQQGVNPGAVLHELPAQLRQSREPRLGLGTAVPSNIWTDEDVAMDPPAFIGERSAGGSIGASRMSRRQPGCATCAVQ